MTSCSSRLRPSVWKQPHSQSALGLTLRPGVGPTARESRSGPAYIPTRRATWGREKTLVERSERWHHHPGVSEGIEMGSSVTGSEGSPETSPKMESQLSAPRTLALVSRTGPAKEDLPRPLVSFLPSPNIEPAAVQGHQWSEDTSPLPPCSASLCVATVSCGLRTHPL